MDQSRAEHGSPSNIPGINPQGTTDANDHSLFSPFCANDLVDRRRRNLPHWSQTGCTYFVTYRLADSLPKLKLLELQRQKAIWIEINPKPWTPAIERDFQVLFGGQIERWLD